MYCIISEHTDPYFNLASEEYLLRDFREEVFLLYRNTPTVIVGKHQNTLAEINLSYVREQEIRVARRISGGGTVYHDLGNLVFAFFTRGREDQLVDYERYTRPVIEAMGEMGLAVQMGSRHELLLNGRKISGTASHVFKKKVLHHGTLLYSTDLEKLSASLAVHPDRFEDRAVKSIRSEVTNIRDHLEGRPDISNFTERLMEFFLSRTGGARWYRYSREDLAKISHLRDEKYSTWEWNYGYSPKYQFIRDIQTSGSRVRIRMQVRKGIIGEVEIQGGLRGNKDPQDLEKAITGARHDPEFLRQRLSEYRVEEYIRGLDNDAFLSGIF